MFTIFLPQITARTEYIFEYIFTQQLGINFTTTSDQTAFEKYAGEKMNYSAYRFNNELFIAAHSLLLKRNIETQNVPVIELNGTKVLFPNDNSCDLGFDIFSAVFYMLSRYEEYVEFKPDLYGRYNVTESLAFKNNFLKEPVVDKWIIQFKNVLNKKFPNLKFKPSKFEAIVTYDVDVAYKFEGRNAVRNAGSFIKDLFQAKFKNIVSRNEVLQKKKADPWDTYNYIEKIISKNNLTSIFFFLVGDNSKNDRNLSYKNPVMKSLVNKIKTFSEIGIHPSFKSSIFTKKILLEKKRLEEICGKNITKSRQHFLKFRLPQTYNTLIESGITEDYSMGFPYEAGFRAGTSKPFYFYDLLAETTTTLKIFPITLMDGNFFTNGNQTHENILEDITNLINEVKNLDGTFLSIWHNHTVSDTEEFRNWRFIHDKMIENIVLLNESSSA